VQVIARIHGLSLNPVFTLNFLDLIEKVVSPLFFAILSSVHKITYLLRYGICPPSIVLTVSQTVVSYLRSRGAEKLGQCFCQFV